MTSKQSVTNLILVEALFLIRHCGGLTVMMRSAIFDLLSFVYFIWKLLYVFWLVPPPIIRSAQTTVSTASTICHAITATCRYHGGVGTGLNCGWRTLPTAHSNQFQLFHDSGRKQ
jgi:hypothetical protein